MEMLKSTLLFISALWVVAVCTFRLTTGYSLFRFNITNRKIWETGVIILIEMASIVYLNISHFFPLTIPPLFLLSAIFEEYFSIQLNVVVFSFIYMLILAGILYYLIRKRENVSKKFSLITGSFFLVNGIVSLAVFMF